jgi:two-component system sensor histidine kinase KdpD
LSGRAPLTTYSRPRRGLLSFTGRIEYSLYEDPDIFRMGGMSEISKRWVGPVLVAAALVALTTGILLAIYLAWQAEHLIFGYLIPITFVAVRYGSAPAILTAILSDLCAAYFLYPPDYSIYVADPLQVAEISFFSLLVLATSRFIGGFADDDRLRKRAAPFKKAKA